MIAYLVAAMETYLNNRNLIISIKLESTPPKIVRRMMRESLRERYLNTSSRIAKATTRSSKIRSTTIIEVVVHRLSPKRG